MVTDGDGSGVTRSVSDSVRQSGGVSVGDYTVESSEND